MFSTWTVLVVVFATVLALADASRYGMGGHDGGSSLSSSTCAPGDYRCEERLRGGSTAVAKPEEEENNDVDYDTIALALRSTCEVNRRLCQGTNGATCAGGHDDVRVWSDDVHVHPDRLWFRPVGPGDYDAEQDEETTVFHEDDDGGASVQNLSTLLRRLRARLDCPPVAFALALVYLDRACSAETPRAYGGGPCPHVTGRTVRRLAAAAVVVAARAASSSADGPPVVPTLDARSPLSEDGTSDEEWAAVEAGFLAALGDAGTWVDRGRADGLGTAWRDAFGATPAGIGLTDAPVARAVAYARTTTTATATQHQQETISYQREVAYATENDELRGQEQHHHHHQYPPQQEEVRPLPSADAPSSHPHEYGPSLWT